MNRWHFKLVDNYSFAPVDREDKGTSISRSQYAVALSLAFGHSPVILLLKFAAGIRDWWFDKRLLVANPTWTDYRNGSREDTNHGT